MDVIKSVEFIRNIFGDSIAMELLPESSWCYSNNRVIVSLDKSGSLLESGGAVRIESEGMENRIMLIHSRSGQIYALENCCPHKGRRLDFHDGETVRCCGNGHSEFDESGRYRKGKVCQNLRSYKTLYDRNNLIVCLDQLVEVHP